MKIVNNNPKYGWAGPYEVDRVGDLLKEMEPCFQMWAEKRWLKLDKFTRDHIYKERYIEGYIAWMRRDFESGLVVEEN